ncbi:unnamed protein product [Angiostrongylus costaricensis]|uniref:PHD-type domain-containing protein n=1 Tax=Angiostrongylus costaricensis TaxID=334426 RepID=A0A0R3PCX3_ANGCS|nr:unnamed protein product [Angiostrongylus costaricensis]
MPTKEAVEATPGTPLTKEEAIKLQAQGQLPKDFNPETQTASVHKIKSGDQEIMVIMVDAPPCGCVRLPTGKKKRCSKHKEERRARMRMKKAKKTKKKAVMDDDKKMVKDDDSDRKKVVELRHAGDSVSDDDKPVDGALTPDKICALGPVGVAVLVEVKAEGSDLGPRAHIDKPMRGILVKGPHDTPQFVPEEKTPKDANGQPKYQNYTKGQLCKGAHGEAIFYADDECQPDDRGYPKNVEVKGVDKGLQNKIGETVCSPCEVDVNERGMPVLKQITNENNAPKEKNATVGILTKNNEGIVVFTQTGGQEIGAKEGGANIPTTPNDNVAPNDVIGKVVSNKEGTHHVIPANQAVKQDEKVIGMVLQGNYSEPVFVKDPKATGGTAATGAVNNAEAANKTHGQQIANANILVQSKLQNKTPEEVKKEQALSTSAEPSSSRPAAPIPGKSAQTEGGVVSSVAHGGGKGTTSFYVGPGAYASTQGGGAQAQGGGAQAQARPKGQQPLAAFKLDAGGGVQSVFITDRYLGGYGGGGQKSTYGGGGAGGGQSMHGGGGGGGGQSMHGGGGAGGGQSMHGGGGAGGGQSMHGGDGGGGGQKSTYVGGGAGGGQSMHGGGGGGGVQKSTYVGGGAGGGQSMHAGGGGGASSGGGASGGAFSGGVQSVYARGGGGARPSGSSAETILKKQAPPAAFTNTHSVYL